VYYGAGIYMQSSLGSAPATPVITNNLIEANVNNSPQGQNQNTPAFSLGGGIYVGFHAAPVIAGNTVRLNTAGDFDTNNQIAGGGGIGIYTAWDAGAVPVISRNVVATNSTTGRGGGISVWYGETSLAPSVALIENNLVEYNDAVDGGGIAAQWSAATVRNNTVVNNFAETGAGLSIYNAGNPLDQVTFTNNIVSLNTANQIDGGGGMLVSFADPFVNNNDFHGDLPDEIDGDFDDVDYIGLDGNFSADPMFTNTMVGNRDLRLQSASPAIEAGDNTGAPAVDLDSVPRVQDGDFDAIATVDLGAYEYSPDFDGDSIPDWQDDDDDDDGIPDAADCRDFSASVSSVPGNVPSVHLREIGAGTRVSWDRGFQGHTSNVYRGAVGTFFGDTCLLEERPGRSTVDTDVPAVGSGYYYLISAKNACGESNSAEGVTPPNACGSIDLDTDTDGVADVLDNCAAIANATQDDADGDWVGDTCDNCLALSNADQADGDEDGAGNSCDCAPGNAGITETLPEIVGLTVDFRFPTTLTWVDQGSGVRYDVASGLLSALSADADVSGASCPGDDVTVATWEDPRADPPANDGYYYIVRTQTGSCEGLFGADSNAPRVTPAACM
jgi:hypothetical protein